MANSARTRSGRRLPVRVRLMARLSGRGLPPPVCPSYLGYVQWALATDPPPELRAMVVQAWPTCTRSCTEAGRSRWRTHLPARWAG